MTTAGANHPTAIELLILTRLLIVGEKGEAASKIKRDLEPLLPHQSQGGAFAELLECLLAALVSSGSLVLVSGKYRKTSPRYVLTASGRRHGLDFLAVVELKPKTTWATLRKTYLPARALALPVSSDTRFKTISSEPGFQAVLLKQQYDLSIADIPKPDDATDALAWKLIGFEGEGRKFNPKNVKMALFNRALGNGQAPDFKKAATRLLAQRLGIGRDDPRELRAAVVRRWIDQENTQAEASSARQQAVHSGSTVPPLDLPAFAQHVKTAARECITGRFGGNKVFIAHVWKAVQNDPAFQAMGQAAFKERLAEANNARLLNLSRADLVQAMDPDDVRQSEVHYLSATFHFLRI